MLAGKHPFVEFMNEFFAVQIALKNIPSYPQITARFPHARPQPGRAAAWFLLLPSRLVVFVKLV